MSTQSNDSTEAQQLRLRFENLKREKGITKAAFARMNKVPGGASMISQNISGNRPISLEAASAYASGFGCNLADISPSLAAKLPRKIATQTPPGSATTIADAIDIVNNPEYPGIRRVALKAQAGICGYAVEYLNNDGPPIVFRRDWYTSHHYKPEKMLAMRVAGDSMVPSLFADDLIIINTDQLEPKDGIAFVVSYEGEIVIKRLVRDAGQWWLTSDNQDQRRYPRKSCNGDTEIIGEVVYRQTERI